MLTAGIAGAGVLGRLLAWCLSNAGYKVTVFDPAAGPEAPATGRIGEGTQPYAAGFTAAGMLSPLAELENAGTEVALLGWRSLRLWRHVTEKLNASRPDVQLFRQEGSLLLAHGSDMGSALRVLSRLDRSTSGVRGMPAPQRLHDGSLSALEPGLLPTLHAWLLPQEAQVMPREVLRELARQADGVTWHWSAHVAQVEPGQIKLRDSAQAHHFDVAIDVRGLGAKPGLPLRGVRGEMIWLHAPAAKLRRPVRLMHPRHRVYVVPRPNDLFVVGASEVESEDRSPVSLKSSVELMAAAHSILPALSEARIVHMEANLRPALPDNKPLVCTEDGLIQINGLFRHGWLLAPALIEDALSRLGVDAFEMTKLKDFSHA